MKPFALSLSKGNFDRGPLRHALGERDCVFHVKNLDDDGRAGGMCCKAPDAQHGHSLQATGNAAARPPTRQECSSCSFAATKGGLRASVHSLPASLAHGGVITVRKKGAAAPFFRDTLRDTFSWLTAPRRAWPGTRRRLPWRPSCLRRHASSQPGRLRHVLRRTEAHQPCESFRRYCGPAANR